jgi:hypothetical protein
VIRYARWPRIAGYAITSSGCRDFAPVRALHRTELPPGVRRRRFFFVLISCTARCRAAVVREAVKRLLLQKKS